MDLLKISILKKNTACVEMCVRLKVACEFYITDRPGFLNGLCTRFTLICSLFVTEINSSILDKDYTMANMIFTDL
jgi:hypothetical protein